MLKERITKFLGETGVAKLAQEKDWYKYLIMYVIVGVLFYLAIVKKFEPLLLLPIAFGMLLANLPGADLIHTEMFYDDYYIAKNLTQVFNPETGAFAEALYEPRIQAFIQSLSQAGLNDIVKLVPVEGSANKVYEFVNNGLTEQQIETVMSIFKQHFGLLCNGIDRCTALNDAYIVSGSAGICTGIDLI